MRGRIYRTAPFHGPDTDPGGQPTLWYWTYEEGFGADQKDGLIRAQEIAISFKMGQMVAPALPAIDGIEKLIALENAARNDPNFKPANAKNDETFKQLGHEYHAAIPYQRHPAYITKQHQTNLKAHAKSAKPMQPKPRAKGASPK